jgi:RNA polymerase sigma factor (TIGR02999 family)
MGSSTERPDLVAAAYLGDVDALNELMPLVYDELRRMAKRQLRREPEGHLLQTTSLVHEVYLRLAGASEIEWRGSQHLLALAARLMRRILVDHARSRGRAKRGAGANHLPFNDAVRFAAERSAELAHLDDALHALAQVDERKAQVVEMRFFGGMSVEETAAALAVSPDTVMRDWRLAKVWLLREMRRGAGHAA